MLRFCNYTEIQRLEAVKRNGDSLRYVTIKSRAILEIATAYKKEYEQFINQ